MEWKALVGLCFPCPPPSTWSWEYPQWVSVKWVPRVSVGHTLLLSEAEGCSGPALQ